MNVFYPAYYQDFLCIADQCPDSCCKEWAVDVDAEAAAYYRTLPGALGDRLRSVMEDNEDGAVMVLEDGRCPMWRNDGLCRIQAELGHNALCQTCREFPRLRHDYGDFVELGLELSCPEAARLILSGHDQTLCHETAQTGAVDYDADVMSTLLSSRNRIRAFLTDPAYAPNQLLALLLLYAYEVQNEIDGGEPAVLEPESTLAQAVTFIGDANVPAFLNFFKDLEILTPRWQDRLNAPSPGFWTASYRQLIRYFVDRYWLQAVSDFDLACRAKLIVSACLLIRVLGGDLMQTAQLFSKEIENDPDNVEAILSGAYTSSALTDANLLALLLT